MKTITIYDLRYQREKELFDDIHTFIESNNVIPQINILEQIHKQEICFFKYLSNAIKIDNTKNIKGIIENLKKLFDLNLEIDMFLHESNSSSAQCIPRISYKNKSIPDKLIIIVSQHFFNNLKEIGQNSILAHEIAHLLFKHTAIPSNYILHSDYEIEDIKDLKSNILKWNICAEISCDIIGFCFTQKNKKAYLIALLKYFTGLSNRAFEYFEEEDLVENVLKQYDEISNYAIDNVMYSHPLTPLRFKIISEIAESNLIKYFEQSVSDDLFEQYKQEYNNLIDALIKPIYPEIIPNSKSYIEPILFDMGIAVIMSDGNINKKEIDAVTDILDSNNARLIHHKYQAMINNFDSTNYMAVIDEIIDKAIVQTKNNNTHKKDIIYIIKMLLVIASSDNYIRKEELDTISRYARAFDVSQDDIAILIHRMNLK